MNVLSRLPAPRTLARSLRLLLPLPLILGILGILGTIGLTGCASSPATDSASAQPGTANALPASWTEPLPAANPNSQALHQWWTALGDPLLSELIDAAQAVSPTLATARANWVQARSARTQSQAAGRPSLDANLLAQRGVTTTTPAAATLLQGSLDASWELDLFGANAAEQSAADARYQGAQAQWHSARVSIAAETASDYWGWQTCRLQSVLLQQEVDSRRQTARLTDLSAQAGLNSPLNATLSNAALADSQSRAVLQQSQCDTDVKALVALTGWPETTLRQRLQAAPPTRISTAPFQVNQVPAQLLTQRPDIYAAQQDVNAASADLGAANARRYPRLTLAGSIGALELNTANATTDLSTWSIGPLSLNLPIFDGGKRKAAVETATARYDEAASIYRSKVRQAVREVEAALVALASASERAALAHTTLEADQQALHAMQAKLEAGSANRLDREEALRTLISARTTLSQLELDRNNAWIALYRALGGGWNGSSQPE